MNGFTPPARDCGLCPRLVAFRDENATKFPQFHNAPVDPFGPLDASLLIVGMAPGLKGANATGRPFTGDGAGDLLYATLLKVGRAEGRYDKRPDDGLRLVDARITNAARCVPPQNKLKGAEIAACRPFLINEIKAMTNLRHILALGLDAHKSVLKALDQRQIDFKFAHNAVHDLGPSAPKLVDSYHCSRYNTNTGRLTPAMFDAVFESLENL